MSARRCARVVRVLIDDAVREERDGQALDVVRDRVVAAFDQGQRLHGAVQRLAAARADAER